MQINNVMIHKKFKRIIWLFNKHHDIPADWEIKQIKDIAKINPEHIEEDYMYDNIEYIDISSISDYTIKQFNAYSLKNRPSRAQRIVKNNDILLSTVRPYLKSFVLIQTDKFNLICSTGFTVVRSFDISNVEFLYNYFKSKLYEVNYISKMEGMAYPAITSSVVSNSLIPLPCDKKEIKKIASILSRVDALIETTQECIEKTQKLKKGLMQILLTKGITHKKFKNINLNCSFIKLTVARKWTLIPLENFIKIDSGDYFPYAEITSKGMAILKIDNVMYGKIDWTNKTYLNKKYLQTKDVILLNKDDIVLALNRPITNDNVKVAKLTNNDIPCILYQRVGKIVVHDTNKIHVDFLYTYLSSSIFKLILNRILIGTDQPYVKTTELLRQKILIPNTIKEQQKIASILSEVDAFGKCVNQIIDIFILKNLLLNYDIIHQTKLSIFINVYTKILILYKNNIG